MAKVPPRRQRAGVRKARPGAKRPTTAATKKSPRKGTAQAGTGQHKKPGTGTQKSGRSPSTGSTKGAKKRHTGEVAFDRRKFKTPGLSITIKFTIVVNLIIIGLLLASGIVGTSSLVSSLNKEINRRGELLSFQSYYDQLREKDEEPKDYQNRIMSKLNMILGSEIGLEQIVQIESKKNNIYGNGKGTYARSRDIEQKTFTYRTYDGGKGTGTLNISEGVYEFDDKAMVSERVRAFEYRDCVAYLSIASIDASKKQVTLMMIAVGIFGLGLGFIASIMLARKITQPLEQLVNDMQIVATGNLDHVTKATTQDEIGTAAKVFNEMTRSLKEGERAKMTQQSMEQELAIATEIQHRLLPKEKPKLPPCVRIGGQV